MAMDAKDVERYIRDMKRLADDWTASKDPQEQTRGGVLLMLVGICEYLRDRADRLEHQVSESQRG